MKKTCKNVKRDQNLKKNVEKRFYMMYAINAHLRLVKPCSRRTN